MIQATGKTQKTDRDLMIVFWNLGIGGVQRKILDISKYIESNNEYRNLQIHLVIRDRKPFSFMEKEKCSQTHTHYFPESIKYTSRFLFPLFILWKMFILKPEIVLAFLHTASAYSITAARALFWRDTRVVLNEDILTSPDVDSATKRKLITLFYPHADRIITPTTAAKDDLVRHFGVPTEKLLVVPNWTTLNAESQENQKKFDLLFVGRFTKQKNIPALIRAVERLKHHHPQIKTCLIGEGEGKESVMDLVREKRLSANIVIKEPTHKIKEYLLQSKIFVLTSDYEGMPIALLEAKTFGIPAVIANYPGAEEAVDNGRDGYICNTKEEFVDHIHKLITDNSLREKLGQCAKRRARSEFGVPALKYFFSAVMI